MNKVELFFKIQFKYLVKLLFLFTVPLILFFQFSPYPLPYIQFVFIGALAASQYIGYNSVEYRKKMTPFIRRYLNQKLARVPKNEEINFAVSFAEDSRGFAILITGVSILLSMIYYGQIL